MLITVTGFGRGKTTSAAGTALRSLAADKKVVFFQFLKTEISGEIDYLMTNNDFFFISPQSLYIGETETKDLTKKLFQEVYEYTFCDLIILDDILVAVEQGLLPKSMLKSFITRYRHTKDIYLTGKVTNQAFRDWLFLNSDIATNMYAVRHIFDSYCETCQQSYPYYTNYCSICGAKLTKGSFAKKGIEF